MFFLKIKITNFTFLLFICQALSLSFTQPLKAQNANLDSLFVAANTAFSDQKFEEASTAYESILEQGKASTALYYNLGNVYFRQEKVALAMLNYERAKRLAPNDAKIDHNINMTNGLLSKKIQTYPILFYKRWWLNVVNFFNSGTWSLLALICLWGALFLAIFYLVSNAITKQKRAFIFGLLLFVMTFLFTFLAYKKYQKETNKDYAIVMVEDIPLKSGPSNTAKDITFLPEGAKIFIVERLNDWWKITLTSDQEGWINQKHLEEI